MDLQLIASFALATLFETLSPGPTLALVVDTRARFGRPEAQKTVIGITLANILWVITAIIVVYAGATSFNNWASQIFRYIGTAYLIFLASGRILSSTVEFITRKTEEINTSSRGANNFLTGFLAHFGNPLTITYYLATFGIATLGKSVETAIIFGVIAIVSDLLVYYLFASFSCRLFESVDIPKSFVRLLAGFFFLYLVAHVFSIEPKSSVSLAMTPGITLVMLLSFLSAAIVEAHHLVLSRKGKNNKMLWHVVGLWAISFSVAAVFGALYALIQGIGASAIKLDALIEHRMRVCFVVSAVIAAALSFSKAFGELQDDQSPQGNDDPICSTCWQASPRRVGLFTLVFLVAVLLLLTFTGFRVDVNDKVAVIQGGSGIHEKLLITAKIRKDKGI